MITPRHPRRPSKPSTGPQERHPEANELTVTGSHILYTPEQAALKLQIRASWLRRKAAARLIPCTFLGKHLRFSPADLAAIVAAAAEPAAGRRARVRPARPPRMST